MSSTTLRHYKTTFANSSQDRERRIRDMKKRFHARVSRRRVKQSIRHAMHKFNLV